jgi:hypothetical protein
MNELLLKSLKITYETDPDHTLDTIASSIGESKEALIEFSNNTSIPTSIWKKSTDIESEHNLVSEETLVCEQESSIISDNDTEPKPEDKTRMHLDELTNSILVQARTTLATMYDPSPKDLKDMAAIVQTIEAYKYPKKQTNALQVDLKNGIVNFLSQIEDDM